MESRQLLTIPNGLTALRALGVPLFLYLFLVKEAPLLSFAVLAVGAATDYFDGKLARALHQESAFGAAFDPAIDRLYIVATIIAMAIKGYLPWVVVGILLLRDLWMVFALATYRKRTGKNFTVTFLGKAATFNLLYAFPLLLLQGHPTFGPGGAARKSGNIGQGSGGSEIAFSHFQSAVHIFGWSFAMWGIALYVVTAIQYTRQAFSRES